MAKAQTIKPVERYYYQTIARSGDIATRQPIGIRILPTPSPHAHTRIHYLSGFSGPSLAGPAGASEACSNECPPVKIPVQGRIEELLIELIAQRCAREKEPISWLVAEINDTLEAAGFHLTYAPELLEQVSHAAWQRAKQLMWGYS